MSSITVTLERRPDDTNVKCFCLRVSENTVLGYLDIWHRKCTYPRTTKVYTTRQASAVSCYPLFRNFTSCRDTLSYFNKLGFDTTELRQAMVEAGWEKFL